MRNPKKIKPEGIQGETGLVYSRNIIQLDLSALDDVRAFVDQLQETVMRLHTARQRSMKALLKSRNKDIDYEVVEVEPKVVLINNAGIAWREDEPDRLTDDGFDRTLQTNYLAPVLLTELLRKRNLLRRVVHVSS